VERGKGEERTGPGQGGRGGKLTLRYLTRGKVMRGTEGERGKRAKSQSNSGMARTQNNEETPRRKSR